MYVPSRPANHPKPASDAPHSAASMASMASPQEARDRITALRQRLQTGSLDTNAVAAPRGKRSTLTLS